MKSICIKDKDIEDINTKELKLSILFTQNGLSYSIYHTQSKRFYSLVSKNFDAAENNVDNYLKYLTEEKLNLQQFQEVNVVIANKKSTIVPEALYLEDNIPEIYALNFKLKEDSEILACHLPKSGNTFLFTANSSLIVGLRNMFGDCNFFSQSYAFIESHYVKNKIAEDSMASKMSVQVFDDFIEVIVFEKSELSFYNTFRCKTDNDILYYIINVFEQLKLSQTETSIGFSGFIETDNIAILNLRKFVSIVYFESQNTDYKYYYKFQENSPHYFYNFLNVC